MVRRRQRERGPSLIEKRLQDAKDAIMDRIEDSFDTGSVSDSRLLLAALNTITDLRRESKIDDLRQRLPAQNFGRLGIRVLLRIGGKTAPSGNRGFEQHCWCDSGIDDILHSERCKNYGASGEWVALAARSESCGAIENDDRIRAVSRTS